jgi:hypothetical protein
MAKSGPSTAEQSIKASTMELVRIEASSDVERLSEKECIMCFQDFTIGDEIAILPAWKKPLDTIELWERIAYCVHNGKPINCPHCRFHFDTAPTEKFYPRDKWPYRPPEHLNRTFLILRTTQTLLLEGLHEQNAAMGELHTQELCKKDANGLYVRAAGLIQAHSGGDINEILADGGQDTKRWPVIAARLELLKAHWRRQVPTLHFTLSMTGFRQSPTLNDLI